MINQDTLRKAAVRLPGPLKSLAKAAYYRGRHWAQPDLKQFGTVQYLYFWAADGDPDTILLRQNYFSAFYPSLDTGMKGLVQIFEHEGVLLGTRQFSLPKNACAKFRVSTLLQDMNVRSPGVWKST